MLFLAQFQIDLDQVEIAMAKRLEFDECKPDDLQIICEYNWHGSSTQLGGFFVFEAPDVSALNFLVMYYGRTLRLDIRPCSDVLSTIQTTRATLAQMPG
jgi:hypothetical protein